MPRREREETGVPQANTLRPLLNLKHRGINVILRASEEVLGVPRETTAIGLPGNDPRCPPNAIDPDCYGQCIIDYVVKVRDVIPWEQVVFVDGEADCLPNQSVCVYCQLNHVPEGQAVKLLAFCVLPPEQELLRRSLCQYAFEVTVVPLRPTGHLLVVV
ncbi:MAG: hypothetical protein IMZ62_13390, partial [Chloroflexi bacterium]|nr:hypothetical protein [Chloroflexota bacterium]